MTRAHTPFHYSLLANQRGDLRSGWARTALQVVQTAGAIAASYAGVWWGIIATVGHAAFWAMYDTATAETQVNEQPSLADLKIQTSSLGKVLTQLWGTDRVAGNVFWATDKVEHQERNSEGGKGGPEVVSIEKTYTVSWAIGLADCRMTGPMSDILRIWRDTTLFMDRSQTGDGAIQSFSISEPGEGYVIGGTGGVGGGNNDAGYVVDAINVDGGITSLTITAGGSGYHVSDQNNPEDDFDLHRNLATTGDGAAIWITSISHNTLPDNWAFYRGTSDQLPDPTIEADKGVGNVPAWPFRCYVVITNDELGRSGRTYNYTFELSQKDGGALLVDVVTALCTAAGLAGHINTTDLPEGNVNMSLVSVESLRAPLEQLAQIFRFYTVASGTILKFRKRGSGPVVATIPADALDAGENHHGDAGVKITRRQQLDMPTQLSLTYVDKEQNYQQSVQRAQRYLPTDAIENARAINTSLVVEKNRARQTVQELLQDAWLQRQPLQTTLSRTYAYLEPGDRIVISARGLSYGIVLNEVAYGQPGLLEMQASADTAWIVDAPGATGGGEPIPHPPLPDTENTLVYLLNLPAGDASDTTPRYHAAFDGLQTPWPGAALWRSIDGEASYQQLTSTTLEAWTGIVADAMADADAHVLDVHTVITVILDQGTLTSISDAALYEHGNLSSLGNEIFCFGVAELVAPGTYELSRFLRGRRGTEWATGTHVDDERLFILDAAIRKVDMLSVGERNITRDYKSPTSGESLADAYHTTFAPTAANLIPFSVAYPRAVQSGADWTFFWFMRARYGGSLINLTLVSFDFDHLGFRIDLFTDGTYATLVRSILTDGGLGLDAEAEAEFLYTEAEQIADYGSAQSTLYYRIVQLTTTSPSRAEDLVAA